MPTSPRPREAIRSTGSLRARIPEKPAYWSQILLARLALRVLPLTLLAASKNSERTALFAFRAAYISWALLFHEKFARARIGYQEARRAGVATLDASRSTSDEASYAAIQIAAFAARAISDKNPSMILARAARFITSLLPNQAEDIWASVDADLRYLEAARRPRELIELPLWLDDVRGDARYVANFPIWARRPFDLFANSVADKSWRIVVDWYRAILPNSSSGAPRSLFGEDADLNITTMNDEFWNRKSSAVLNEIAEIARVLPSDGKSHARTMKEFIVALVSSHKRAVSLEEIYSAFRASEFEVDNASIRGRVNSLVAEEKILRVGRGQYAPIEYAASVEDEPARGRAPSVPTTMPAAIEPVWQEGKLRLPGKPLSSDLQESSLAAALNSLRDELVELADDCDVTQNIDTRPAGYLRRLAERIPDGVPTQDVLFRLGHAYEYLEEFSRTTDAEWPDFLAARYRKLVLQYDRTIRQFPHWRAFVRNAAEITLSEQQVIEAPIVAGAVASVLKSEDAREIVDPSVSIAIDEVKSPIVPLEAEIEMASEQLAEDLLESINNVLKRLSELALALKELVVDPLADWTKSVSSEAFSEFARESKKSIVKEFGHLGRDTGPALGRVLRRFVKGVSYTGLGGGGFVLIAPRLIQVYPETFSWLGPVLRFLGILP